MGKEMSVPNWPVPLASGCGAHRLGLHPWLWWVGPGKEPSQTSLPRPPVLQLREGAGQSVIHREGGKTKCHLLSPRGTHGRERGPWEGAAGTAGACGASGKSRALEALGLPIAHCFPTRHPAPHPLALNRPSGVLSGHRIREGRLPS